MVKKESVILILHNGRNEWLKGANSCTYIFNLNLTLLYSLSNNFQRFLRKLKVKTWKGNRNGSNITPNKAVSDELVALFCYLINYQLIFCSSSYLSFHISFIYTKYNPTLEDNLYISIKNAPIPIIPKIFKLHCQNKTERRRICFLNLWIITQFWTWT